MKPYKAGAVLIAGSFAACVAQSVTDRGNESGRATKGDTPVKTVITYEQVPQDSPEEATPYLTEDSHPASVEVTLPNGTIFKHHFFPSGKIRKSVRMKGDESEFVNEQVLE